ncbi:hypothetical protein [Fibrella aquatica]|uniref:hypothetical protein n=1 Tax=Fibrella aquatica TaxID=3242487 RepID=UPI003521944F
MEAEATNPRQEMLKLAVGALAGVLALLAYLFMGSRNETLEVQKLLTSKVEQFASTQIKLDSISKVLDQKLVEVRQLGGNVTELERIKRQLESDKKRLKSDFTFSIQQYDLKIRDYKNFLTTNDADLRKLRAENGSLLSRTRTLEEEKQHMLTENEGLKFEKAALVRAVVDYSLQNADLQSKVTLASAMKAVGVEVAALATNGKERRTGPYKASRIDRLKIDFVLLANPVSQKGDKDVYVRILDPRGAVVSESGVGGVLMIDGRELGYSIRHTVSYANNDQQVELLYRRENAYKPGSYTVELYAEGFKIGAGRFDVK